MNLTFEAPDEVDSDMFRRHNPDKHVHNIVARRSSVGSDSFDEVIAKILASDAKCRSILVCVAQSHGGFVG